MRKKEEEKEQLKPKSMASSSLPHNHTDNNINYQNNSKVREEGELSSSDDDALLTGSAAPLPSNSVQNASPPIGTSLLGVNSGNLSSGKKTSGSTQIQSRTPYRKSFSTNQAPLKSTKSGWRAPAANGNLVISFSDDDDSGSDVEDRREKASACDRPPLALNSNRRPPTLPNVKMQTVSKTAEKEGKVMPKKVSSSMTKIREPSVKSAAATLAEQRTWWKNSNVTERSLASQDPGCSKNLDMSSSKLEDLRQQIAVRENELKLKLVQQNKENVSETGRDANTIGQRELREVSSRKSKSVPADSLTQPKEPERKRLRTEAPVVNVSCSLSDWISVPKQSAVSAGPLERSISKHLGVVNKNQSSSSRSAPNQDIHECNMSKCDATSAPKNVKSTSDSSLHTCALPVSTRKFESSDVSPEDNSLFFHLGKSRDLRSGEPDLESLFEFEDLHDKKLEEAQEHRRKCEVEERNALNAYRRAQRALLEANARCTYLYRKRELYSTQLRSFLLEDSNTLYPSRHLNETAERWKLANNISEVNLDIIPSTRQLEDFEAGNRLGYDSNVQSADGDAHNRSSANEDGRNLGSEACSEPDASSSELVRGNKFGANGIHSPSGDSRLSPDDDYELDNRSPYDSVRCTRAKDGAKESVMIMDSAANFSTVGSQDPLFLEEYLRTKLISRLGVNSVKRSGIGENSESSVQRASDEGVTATKPLLSVSSDKNISSPDCRDGPKEPEGGKSKSLLNTQNQLAEDLCLIESPTTSYNPKECRPFSAEIASKSSLPLSSSFKSPIKALGPVNVGSMQIEKQQYGSLDTCTKNDLPFRDNEDNLCLDMTSFSEHLVKWTGFGKIDSYTCKSAIDPFWPLCMYELRGRCNNDECPWQHAKDYTNSDECQAGWASNRQSLMCQTGGLSVLTPPRYLVCLDSLKDDSRAYGSLKARYFGSYGKNIFSCSLAVSSSIIKHLPSNEPCLHGNDGCVESDGGSGHSLYFQSRNGTGNPLRNGLADNDQNLEMALIILSQEVNKIEATKKALSVLCRALEGDPTCIPIWIIYLLLYYSTKSSIGEVSKKSSVQEDLFSHAVKRIEKSYELWLLYINSRMQLNERFSAYERALSRMCYYASSDDGQRMHRSAAILDLFLQMLYCFCVSGNVAKAVQRIHRLVSADGDCDESYSVLISDILQCLTISDKCVLWVCCVYLVIYRKLPDSLVQQFEFEKDVSMVEWPSTHLTVEEKQHVSNLMEMAIDSVGLHIDVASLDSSTHKAVHLFAANHIKLTAAIEGVESCKIYLDKYRNSYLSCVDLILLSLRVQGPVAESKYLEWFEETTSNWPKNIPGIQSIWNQFAEYALERGRLDSAKEIMDRWFHSAWVPVVFQKRLVDGEIVDSKNILADPQWGSTLSSHASNCNNMDLVFGLLNLSLYKLFHNDVLEAHVAIEKALNVAEAGGLQHCVREHAAFLLNNGSQVKKDTSVRGLIDALKGYVIHARPVSLLEPLTQKFIEDIQKPRTRQLVRNILSPISSDSHLVNSVLEIWFGSSLLPPKLVQLKEIVDFVEDILEISPSNYQLVISVCKYICRDSDSGKAESASVLFWASSLLVNTMYHSIPFPPEYVWVEAAEILGKLTSVEEICESFHHRALSVYPFSINLWKSFRNQSKDATRKSSVVNAAREKGLDIE